MSARIWDSLGHERHLPLRLGSPTAHRAGDEFSLHQLAPWRARQQLFERARRVLHAQVEALHTDDALVVLEPSLEVSRAFGHADDAEAGGL